MLRNPFYPDRKRHIYYYIYCLLIILATAFLIKRTNIDWESVSLISILPESNDDLALVTIPDGDVIN